jgi:Fe-S cluster assembly protein SufD
MKAVPLSIDTLGTVVGALPDDGLAASRRAALEQLRSRGLPGVSDEDWKYTDLAVAINVANDWLESGANQPDTAAIPDVIELVDADWIVINNGQPGSELPSIDGVDITRLSDSEISVIPEGRLGDLNVALLRDGLHISIGGDVELKRPIGILVNDDASAGPGVSQIRVEIETATNSKASFVEYHTSRGDAGQYTNSVVRLAVGDAAHVKYVRIQDRNSNHSLTSHTGVTLGRDAEFRHCAFDFGGQLVRSDVTIDIEHAGSHAEFSGLYLVGDGQHVDNHTRVDHRTGPAASRQEYRGVLTGKARGVWNGKAIVHEGADGTDAEQANHNLLLSKNAEIDAKPELEIYADDVKCSHGTTVGQLDETALFYLRSRGLSRHEARQLLTRAFAQAIVSRSPIDSLHEYLSDRIASRLDELMQEAES